MPGFDGKGPNGMGPMSGRGMGRCADGTGRNFGRGFGRGCGMGFGRCFGMRNGFCPWVQAPLTKEEEKKLVEEEIKQLETYLKELKKQLE